jgi:hypothetical protein
MKWLFVPLGCICAACTTVEAVGPRTGLPWSLMDQESGDATGVWRQVRSNGQPARDPYMLTIDLRISTFAVQKGCTATGGVMSPLAAGRYRIDHYTSGFAVADCPPWQAVPELAPFDPGEVQLVRRGRRLTATGATSSAEFVRFGRD